MSLTNTRSPNDSSENPPTKKIKYESQDRNPSASSLSQSSAPAHLFNPYYPPTYHQHSLYDIPLPLSTPIPSYPPQASSMYSSTSTPFLTAMQPTPQLSFPCNYTQNTVASSASSTPSSSTTHLNVNNPSSSSGNVYPSTHNTSSLPRSSSNSKLSSSLDSPHKSFVGNPTNVADSLKSHTNYLYTVLQSIRREDFDTETDSSVTPAPLTSTTASLSSTTASSSSLSGSSGSSAAHPNLNKKVEELISNIIFEIGLKNSSPKILIPLMSASPSGLSTEHIKSHLQKYRKHKSRYQEDFHYLYHNHIKLTHEEYLKKFNTFEKVNDYLLKKINSNNSSGSVTGSSFQSGSSDKKSDADKTKKDDEGETSKDEVKKKMTQLMNLQKLLLDSSSLLADWKSIVRDVADRGDRINREILTLLAEPDELECLR